MNSLFDDVVNSDCSRLIENLINPLTPYFICNHYISTEIKSDNSKYVGCDLYLAGNDLLKNKNYNDIKNFDIIQVQVDYIDFFHDKVLPIIVKKNLQVVLITSQWHLPQIHRNYKTDSILVNKNILLWISQNPIYENIKKYMGFPYGLFQNDIIEYVKFLKSNVCNNYKEIKILNQCSIVHPHLPKNHIRRVHDIFGKLSGPKLNYAEYLSNISKSEFVISTPGDREDSYRHYECIGLDAIPISNISQKYYDIFENNIIYSTDIEMINMINNKSVNINYQKPNKDILTTEYWKKKIQSKMETLI
jgi:hypothetical protein